MRSWMWPVAVRPWLWTTAVATALRLAPSGWWRRWPPVPRPDRQYLRFRMVTNYGEDRAVPDAADLIRYLEWCRRADGGRG